MRRVRSMGKLGSLWYFRIRAQAPGVQGRGGKGSECGWQTQHAAGSMHGLLCLCPCALDTLASLMHRVATLNPSVLPLFS